MELSKKTIVTSALFLFALASQSQTLNEKKSKSMMTNPLLQRSSLQYQAPPFNLIKDSDFKPAFEYSLKIHDIEIKKIADNVVKPTFENTVLALEISGVDLNRAAGIFSNLTGSNTNPTLQAIDEEYSPIFSAHNDKIYLNSKLYQRIKALDLNALKGEDKKLTEYYLQQFELAGANLSDSDKEKMKKINGELASLSTSFSNKLLIARKNGAVLFDSATDLAGLSSDEIANAKDKAKEAGHEGKYLIGLLNTTQQPLLQSLTNRATREKIFKSSWSRAEKNDVGDTREIVEKMAKLRLQKVLQNGNCKIKWQNHPKMRWIY
jgi:peptidyl-dipeptidase Dcp